MRGTDLHGGESRSRLEGATIVARRFLVSKHIFLLVSFALIQLM